jgi:hypothetical protein
MASKAVQVVPLAQETRTALPTSEAAAHLSKSPQTLLHWNHQGDYPACLRPEKVRGRLYWPVAGLRHLLNVEAA